MGRVRGTTSVAADQIMASVSPAAFACCLRTSRSTGAQRSSVLMRSGPRSIERRRPLCAPGGPSPASQESRLARPLISHAHSRCVRATHIHRFAGSSTSSCLESRNWQVLGRCCRGRGFSQPCRWVLIRCQERLAAECVSRLIGEASANRGRASGREPRCVGREC